MSYVLYIVVVSREQRYAQNPLRLNEYFDYKRVNYSNGMCNGLIIWAKTIVTYLL